MPQMGPINREIMTFSDCSVLEIGTDASEVTGSVSGTESGSIDEHNRESYRDCPPSMGITTPVV